MVGVFDASVGDGALGDLLGGQGLLLEDVLLDVGQDLGQFAPDALDGLPLGVVRALDPDAFLHQVVLA
jgi:hypothetical protein